MMEGPAARLQDSIVSGLREDGYTVLTAPDSSLLPSFMSGYRPDIIAIGDETLSAKGKPRNVAVEISDRRSQSHVGSLAGLFKNHDDWVFRVYYVPASEAVDQYGSDRLPTSESALVESIAVARSLAAAGHSAGALILGWSVLEAVARKMRPLDFSRSQTPATLVEKLAAKGDLLPSEADLARRFGLLRNLVVHGWLDTPIDGIELRQFLDVLSKLYAVEDTHLKMGYDGFHE